MCLCQRSFSGAISRYSHSFFLKSHTYSRCEKKITLRIFLISCRKVLLKCHPFSGIQTILHDWFSHYFCATFHFLYNCWKPVFEICIIGKICCKNYMSIACFFCKRFSLISLNQHKKQLKMSSDTTKENCLSQRSTTPTFFLF